MTKREITDELIKSLSEKTNGEHGYKDLLAIIRAQEWHTENRWIFRDDIYGMEIDASLSRMIIEVIEEYKQHFGIEE